MDLISTILIVLLILFVPRIMVLLAGKYRFLGMLSPVFLCYLTGFLFSFLLPDSSFAMTLAELLIPIAIPLILFSSDFKSIGHLARPILRSYFLICISVVLVSATAFLIFRNVVPDAHDISGMLIGLYTGGTPNLMSIGVALGVSETEIVLANTADLLMGGFYFFFLISVMPIAVKKFLPAKAWYQEENPDLTEHLKSELIPEKQPFSLRNMLHRLLIVLLGIVSLAAAAGIALLITGRLDVMIIMLIVTTLGIAFSFVKKVRTAPGTFATGQYLIYMFSVAIGISFQLTELSSQLVNLLLMVGFVQFGAVLLHFVLARIFKMDGQITLITSTAGIYGPAFVIPVADAMRNRSLILPGLLCGILGYAIGNYLGIGVSLLLGLF